MKSLAAGLLMILYNGGSVKEHTGGLTPEVLGNAAADRLATRGSTDSTSFATIAEQLLSTHHRVHTTASN